ncbi:MAG: sensor histidine kinase [Bacillota bacterium]
MESYLRDVSSQLSTYIQQDREIDKNIFSEVELRGPMNFKIYNQQGEVVLESRSRLVEIAPTANLGTIKTIKKEIDFNNKDSAKDKYDSERGKKKAKEVKILYLNQQVEHQGQKFYIQVLTLQHIKDDFFDILLLVLGLINLVAIVLSVIIGSYIAKKILRPIEEITETAQQITINNLEQRIDTTGPNDELQNLAVTFNNMIDRLQDSIEKQKQFVADASHELRTPISIIQGYIDLLDRWGTENEEVLTESITAIQEETVSMKEMLEQLLFLARNDKSDYKFNKEQIKLEELITEVYTEMELVAQQQLKLNRLDSATINADVKSIKQLLRIVIDNSIKYTPLEGDISIEVVQLNEWVEIKIQDTGCGIPPAELDKIFTRFYRVEESRTRDTGGAGLGLAIAKWIVKEHQGTIEAESQVGEGTLIKIQLPLDENDG